MLIFLVTPRSGAFVIAMTAAYGAFAYTLYSLAVAHANDHARPEDFVKVSGGLLLLYGFGTMIGPMLGATLMGSMRPESLFLATALPHFLLVGYTIAAHLAPRAGADRRPRGLQDAARRSRRDAGSRAPRPAHTERTAVS